MSRMQTLGDLLPYVRRALVGVGNLSYGDFAISVLTKLAEAGEVSEPPDWNYHGLHCTLRRSYPLLDQFMVEAFFFLLHNGYIAPMSDPPNPPSLQRCNITARGQEWIKGQEPMPEDSRGYLVALNGLVPNLDSVVEQYIEEAVATYGNGRYFAAAVMLGAASEKILYLIAARLEQALQDAAQKKRVTKALSERSLLSLLRVVRDALEHNKKKLPPDIAEGIFTHLLSFSESIRVQRNDAVHPAVAKVSQDQVRLALAAFPHACSISFAFIAWLQGNAI